MWIRYALRTSSALSLSALLLTCTTAPAGERLSFNRDIRPLLSNNCFQCHGPDANNRQADLRLDQPDGVELAFGSDGVESSEAWRRIASEDPDEQMPPPDSHRHLSGDEREQLRRWIGQGSRWEDHWSFVVPRRPEIPMTKDHDWVRNPIDAFVLAKMQERGLRPSPDASRERWLRRVTFDLTGFPPTLEEIDRFLNDRDASADENVVNRLLASDRFGERMALTWMDAARYGDTSVYHADGPRDMWPWRDWVISAYNANMPFDQFTLLQLAGDLVPEADDKSRIAAGFHRNHGTTDEGGAIAEEYRVEYAVDRVKTTATVWMGLTMECAQCHDHKYDPISQEDYYRFFAYFNQASDKGMQTRSGNEQPLVNVHDPINERKRGPLDAQLARLTRQKDERMASIDAAFQNWSQRASQDLSSQPQEPLDVIAHFRLDEAKGKKVAGAGDDQVAHVKGRPGWVAGRVDGAFRCDSKSYLELGDLGSFERTDAFSYGAWIRPEGNVSGAPLARMDDGGAHRGFDLYLNNGSVSAHFIHRWPDDAIKVTTKNKVSSNTWHHVFVTYDGSSKASGVSIYFDGKRQELHAESDSLKHTIVTDKPLFAGRRNPGSPYTGLIDEIRFYERTLTPGEVETLAGDNAIRTLLKLAPEQRSAEQTGRLKRHYAETEDAVYLDLKTRADGLQARADVLAKPVSTVMTMKDLDQPRMTYILNRGSYDSPRKDHPVSPGVPSALPALPAGAPANRLGLAQWIISKDHPLTARVAVNRHWTLLFGQGIVRTPGDFGSQGEWPSNPDLLDWLAVEFMDSEWDVKHIIRQMVTSSSYRQTSRVDSRSFAVDPINQWLSRGPRFRLQGEFIRDNALSASGLLVHRLGGPSTKPYQPAGLWNEVSLSGNVRFVQDQGAGLYRRSMYIYWKRSAPMPVMTIFDAPTREKCVMQRSRTNTPLQALVTLNDPQFVEAARALAERSIREGGNDVDQQITFAYRLLTGCRPTPATLKELSDAYREEREVFADQPALAGKLLAVGESARDPSIGKSEHAAMTIVMSLLLNLDETLTRG